MPYEKLENKRPPPYASVEVKVCGNVAVIRHSDRENHEQTIIKLDKDHYMIASEKTGEVHEFRHNENRLDDKQSLRESLSRLRDYINTNVTDAEKCRWLTLTYRECMSDPERLYSDFKRFNRKCRERYGHYEYIVACEYQRRGSLHLHCVFIFDKTAPFMKNSEVANIWGHGFVNVRKLSGIDDVGSYLTAYLGDATLDELGRLPSNIRPDAFKMVEIEENGVKVKKTVIKGARLALMPPGFHLYRISKGIKKPVISRMRNEEAERLVEGWTLTRETTYAYTDEGRRFSNRTNKRYYNRLRKKQPDREEDSSHEHTVHNGD